MHEAKDKLKERQSTNTIEKLGEKKWRERQLKWINTLNLKSEIISLILVISLSK